MKSVTIDAQGLACPQPVVLTKKALAESDGHIVVLVDSENALENVTRLANSMGCAVGVVDKGSGVAEIRIQKEECVCETAVMPQETPSASSQGEFVFLLDSDYIGTNRELGKVLANGFLNASLNLENKKSSVVLISNGVRLATEGSYALEVLEKVSDNGGKILICGTCLDFFKIRDKVRVGTISNALEILECLTGAGKVIKF